MYHHKQPEYLHSFLTDYFGVKLATSNIEYYKLHGIKDDLIGDGLVFSIQGAGGADNQWFHDSIEPVTDAIPFLEYDSDSNSANHSTFTLQVNKKVRELMNQIKIIQYLQESPNNEFYQYIEELKERLIQASVTNKTSGNMSKSKTAVNYGGIRYQADGHRTVFLSFGFEAITSDAAQDSLIARTVRWLIIKDREKLPPANVQDLLCFATNDFVEVKWTAPGDDGNRGQAAKYDLRYAFRPPSDNIEKWWDNATRIEDEPEPLPAGSPQSYKLTNVDVNTNYYFMLKTLDEFANESGFSNLAVGSTTGSPQIQIDTSTVHLELPKGDSLSTEVKIKNTGLGILSVIIRFEVPSASSSAIVQKNFSTLNPEITNRLFNEYAQKSTAGFGKIKNIEKNNTFLTEQQEPWYWASVKSASIAPNDSLSLNLLFKSDMLELGDYSVDLRILSNDLQRSEVRKQFNLRVNAPTSVDEKEPSRIPRKFALLQNYPNPFNPETLIRFNLPKPAHVNLTIYNLLGQKIRVLLDEYKPAGFHKVSWDGRDQHGFLAPSGLYLYRIKAGEFEKTLKMILLR